MASKFEEILARAEFNQARESLERNGVELAKENQVPAQNVPTAERSDVKEIGQDLQKQGAELKQDTYGVQTPARVGESRPFADQPKYINEQSIEKSDAQKTNVKDDAGLQRDGQQNQPQVNKHENAFTRAQSEPATEKTPAPQKNQDFER